MSDDGGDESDGSWAEVIEEETGKTYYFNEGTGATQWHHPYGSDSDEEGEVTGGGTGGAGAGGGSRVSTGSAEWDEVTDKASGKTYWFNAATGESTWTRPGSGGAASQNRSEADTDDVEKAAATKDDVKITNGRASRSDSDDWIGEKRTFVHWILMLLFLAGFWAVAGMCMNTLGGGL